MLPVWDGYTVEDVEKDLEGLQTMRAFAKNFTYLLNSQKATEESGIEKSGYEEITFTNFI